MTEAAFCNLVSCSFIFFFVLGLAVDTLPLPHAVCCVSKQLLSNVEPIICCQPSVKQRSAHEMGGCRSTIDRPSNRYRRFDSRNGSSSLPLHARYLPRSCPAGPAAACTAPGAAEIALFGVTA
jgi:hypothetical protein